MHMHMNATQARCESVRACVHAIYVAGLGAVSLRAHRALVCVAARRTTQARVADDSPLGLSPATIKHMMRALAVHFEEHRYSRASCLGLGRGNEGEESEGCGATAASGPRSDADDRRIRHAVSAPGAYDCNDEKLATASSDRGLSKSDSCCTSIVVSTSGRGGRRMVAKDLLGTPPRAHA